MNDPTRPAGPSPASDGPLQAARSPSGLADAVRDQASGYANRRRTEAAGFLSEIAKALRSNGAELDKRARAKPFVQTVADNLDALSKHVARRGLRELFRDAEAVARGNPLATALVVGALGYGTFHVLRSGNGDALKSPGEPRRDWGGYP
ncbi:hypothetical protein SAMN05216360_102409 [Methylobacterium phyllostachyos]|uniref:Uncharacterized protein n=1 Tax=Methylobacterium phyllostachyos TaxID=582672 RepID=A0A1G9U5T1_9HYPH|nr:hypothetical protein [Methylobacterium phyllostachyos]SDM54994.1 hypothetical protein SAMN05216360_102409 [Methylobacterium phyllostachyos]